MRSARTEAGVRMALPPRAAPPPQPPTHTRPEGFRRGNIYIESNLCGSIRTIDTLLNFNKVGISNFNKEAIQ
ncbi:hypothetical protein EVAR_41734_1 [Eumeta japonica]|uniref:Uncharacterized protein n=1 Tax=Eumeta variegata TaxID=151549 RepID=A0A4C1XHZ4_EUMVA|nr:hypothetical protein EVAR_41734_1 [Eumeta japonica]